MTDKQSKDLILADTLEDDPDDIDLMNAASTIRRLIAINELLFDYLHSIKNKTNDLDSYDTAKEAIERAEAA